jgi:hypothetical protein
MPDFAKVCSEAPSPQAPLRPVTYGGCRMLSDLRGQDAFLTCVYGATWNKVWNRGRGASAPGEPALEQRNRGTNMAGHVQEKCSVPVPRNEISGSLRALGTRPWVAPDILGHFSAPVVQCTGNRTSFIGLYTTLRTASQELFLGEVGEAGT